MGNGVDQWRVSIGLFDSRVCVCRQRVKVSFSWNFTFQYFVFLLSGFNHAVRLMSISLKDLVNNLDFKLLLLFLILEAGDVEMNPGPNTTEHSLSIIHRVPQGSVLGPLLFLVYINDIAKQLLSLTRLFADDSSLFYAAARLSDIAGIINHDLIMLSNWAIQWLVKFNPLKTEAVLFTLKYFEAFLQLIFDNTPIKFVEDHKHLGITFSQNGQ